MTDHERYFQEAKARDILRDRLKLGVMKGASAPLGQGLLFEEPEETRSVSGLEVWSDYAAAVVELERKWNVYGYVGRCTYVFLVNLPCKEVRQVHKEAPLFSTHPFRTDVFKPNLRWFRSEPTGDLEIRLGFTIEPHTRFSKQVSIPCGFGPHAFKSPPITRWDPQDLPFQVDHQSIKT